MADIMRARTIYGDQRRDAARDTIMLVAAAHTTNSATERTCRTEWEPRNFRATDTQNAHVPRSHASVLRGAWQRVPRSHGAHACRKARQQPKRFAYHGSAVPVARVAVVGWLACDNMGTSASVVRGVRGSAARQFAGNACRYRYAVRRAQI